MSSNQKNNTKFGFLDPFTPQKLVLDFFLRQKLDELEQFLWKINNRPPSNNRPPRITAPPRRSGIK